MPGKVFYEFGGYRLDPIEGTLVAGSRVVRLDRLTCKVLLVFLNNSKRVLSKEFLVQEAWDGNLDTSDDAIAQQLLTLRRHLTDDANNPRFIKTLKKRGYKFLLDVRKVGATGEAAKLYEKARSHFHKSNTQHIIKAIEYFEQIITLNQEYVADAYAGMAESFVLLGTFAHQVMPATEAMEKARQAALSALALDAGIAEAQAALASIAALHDWKWHTAARHFQEAFQLTTNPSVKPLVRAWYAICLASRGEAEHARHEIDHAKADYASSFLILALSGRVAYLAHDSALAIKECEEAIALEEHFFLSHMFKGHALRQLGRYEQALASFRKACELNVDNPVCLAEVAHTYALQQQEQESQAIVKQIEHIAMGRYVSPHVFAVIALGHGDHERVLDYLEQTLNERGAYLIALTTDSVYDPLRSNLRFAALIQKVGFAETE